MKRLAGCSAALISGWMMMAATAQQPPSAVAPGAIAPVTRQPQQTVLPGTNTPAATARVEPLSFWTKRQILNEQQAFETRLTGIERSLTESRKEQQRLAQEARALQARLDDLQLNHKTLLSRLNQNEQKLGETDAKMPALKTDLARQAQMVKAVEDSNRTATKPSGTESKLADVEKRIREQEQVLRQKEKEIEELRKTLAARDANLRKTAAAAAPPASVEDATRTSVITLAPTTGGQSSAVIPPARPAATAAAIPPATQTVSLLTRTINEGNKALREGRVADAEQSFTAALAIDPAAAGGRMGLAACKYMNGMLPEAKAALAEVLKTEPDNSQALGLQGIIAWRDNDLTSASACLNRAIRRDPNDAQLHNYLGIVLHSQGFSEDAVKELNKAIELNPALTDAHYNLAVVLASLRKPRMDEARKSYQNALRLGYSRDDKLEQILYAQP